ncbi:hypothetical protein AAFF_G00368970 [Aldrovandia affinis]|uniref:PRKC apoptosis WT1 regulator protein n=1 Tax=Aldrovandia affinis TaxID=143900 RepID=A0AAD7SHD7_9TELE|nr:hypothetical protein AAFF_G00368970 [Aldrovandia affinis]
MLGDIAASTGGSNVTTAASCPGTNNKSETRSAAPHTELNNNGNPEDPSAGKSSRYPQSEPSGDVCNESDKESLSPVTGSSKGKEKKNSGPSARKGKGQIEKRKLREKRRSTGVVSIPSNESLDELDDDDGGEKERKKEEALTMHNTVQNETMTPDPGAPNLLQDTPRAAPGWHKSAAAPSSEEETGGSKHRLGYGRHGREANSAGGGGLERRLEELEKELARERQENMQMLKAHQDKDELIGKLKEEIDLLNRDLDDIEDENEQLKQENKTLLKVVSQLTRHTVSRASAVIHYGLQGPRRRTPDRRAGIFINTRLHVNKPTPPSALAFLSTKAQIQEAF